MDRYDVCDSCDIYSARIDRIDDGDYVLYADATTEIERLRALLQRSVDVATWAGSEIELLRGALSYAVNMGVQADIEGDRVMFTEAACGCCAVPLKKQNPHIEVFRQAALGGKGE